jgi:hypothetical protein
MYSAIGKEPPQEPLKIFEKAYNQFLTYLNSKLGPSKMAAFVTSEDSLLNMYFTTLERLAATETEADEAEGTAEDIASAIDGLIAQPMPKTLYETTPGEAKQWMESVRNLKAKLQQISGLLGHAP